MSERTEGKNIVILMDGTSNQISEKRSNVLRLYGVLTKSKPDKQLVYYDPGVGTFSPDRWFSKQASKIAEIYGLVTGWGLDRNVKDAYRFLVENYEVTFRQDPVTKKDIKVRDKIYIFGFSRGAYSARVLAGFINALGLIEPRNLNLLDYAYRAYKRIDQNADAKPESYEAMYLFERSLSPDHPTIRMLGLFDTVSSVIEKAEIGWRMRKHAYTSTNPSVETVMQAAAIEEQRRGFPLMPWPKGQEYHASPFDNGNGVPQQVEEVWFAGVHADVGGGHTEEGSALCKVPLVWMINRAKECGLKVSPQSVTSLVYGRRKGGKPYTPPNALGPKTESYRGLWRLMGSRKRVIEEGATVHESVLTRRDAGIALPDVVPATYGIWKDETEYEDGD